MDPIGALKLDASMKNHKLKSHPHFLYSFLPYLLTAMTCSLLCSYPFWLPSIEHFLFITLPHIKTSLLSPKCLFLVVNGIVAFLLGESKLRGLYSSAASHVEVYEEYVERSRTRKMLSTCPGSESTKEFEEKRLTGDGASEEDESEKELGDDTDDKKEAEQEHQGNDDDDDDDDDDAGKDERNAQEDDGIPAEELKKRFEEFIAKVNRERWLEARSLMVMR